MKAIPLINIILYCTIVLTITSCIKRSGAKADISAADFPGIQEALDALPPEGGSVFIPSGTYIIKSSLKPRDNITVKGAGPSTILKACDLITGKTTSVIKTGDKQVNVESPEGFETGMDVFIHKNIDLIRMFFHTLLQLLRAMS